MEPILHLSLPVRDLAESIDFYVDALGCRLGRTRDRFADVWFYGLQLTLHERPEQVLPVETLGVRHFGVTLAADDLNALVHRLEARPVTWSSNVTTEYAGTPKEQIKAKILDPSGNTIEIKTYVDPEAAFAP